MACNCSYLESLVAWAVEDPVHDLNEAASLRALDGSFCGTSSFDFMARMGAFFQ